MGKRRIIQDGTTLTIYTERQQLEDLKALARGRRVSMADVLRDALRRYIGLAAVQREVAKVRSVEASMARAETADSASDVSGLAVLSHDDRQRPVGAWQG